MNNPQRFQQMRDAYARNLVGLKQMLARAERTHRKVNGFTAAQLRESVEQFARFSTLSDEEMVEHLRNCHQRVRERLAVIHAS